MKKIYILLALLISAMMFVGCQKDFNGILTAEIEGYNGSNGKVYINDRYACWHNEDMVAINGVSKPVSIDPATNIATINTGLLAEPPKTITAIYPGEYAADDGSMLFSLPHEQVYEVKDGKQLVKAPMVAYATNVNSNSTVTFRNAGALIQVIVKNETGGAITLRNIELTGSTALWGTVSYSQDPEGEPTNFQVANTLTIASDPKRLSLSFAENPVTLNNQESKDFYIAIPCVNTSLTAKVYYTTPTGTPENPFDQSHSYEMGAPNSRQINRNDIYTMDFSKITPTTITGDGTPNNPYLIYNYEDFTKMNTYESTGAYTYHYKQMNDIEFPEPAKQKPIPTFYGTYNGNNNNITTIKLNESVQGGLFSYILNNNADGKSGIVKNLNLIMTISNFQSDMGCIVNEASDATIENCNVTANITTTGWNLGGIIGSASNCTIKNCTVDGILNGIVIGGIIGYSTSCTIDYCTNKAQINGVATKDGIIGDGSGNTITNSQNIREPIVKPISY